MTNELTVPYVLEDDLVPVLTAAGFTKESFGGGEGQWVREGHLSPDALADLKGRLAAALFDGGLLTVEEHDDSDDE